MKQYIKQYVLIKYQIDSCSLNKTTMGTSRTIDPYCGKDPFTNITHIASDPVSLYI